MAMTQAEQAGTPRGWSAPFLRSVRITGGIRSLRINKEFAGGFSAEMPRSALPALRMDIDHVRWSLPQVTSNST